VIPLPIVIGRRLSKHGIGSVWKFWLGAGLFALGVMAACGRSMTPHEYADAAEAMGALTGMMLPLAIGDALMLAATNGRGPARMRP
jgi:hypothetical protein